MRQAAAYPQVRFQNVGLFGTSLDCSPSCSLNLGLTRIHPTQTEYYTVPIDPTSIHIPVLAKEILELGNASSVATWVDGTAGGGGHCRLVADAMNEQGQVIGIDRDPSVAARLTAALADELNESKIKVVSGSYADLPRKLDELGIAKVDAILLDLGLSSDQLEDAERGFSFQTEGDLDMRFNPEEGEPVWQWLARADEKSIADAIYEYGEERHSRRIAKRIVTQRRETPIRTANQLRELVAGCVPRSAPKGRDRRGRRPSRIDPATRTFQALRILINDELGELKRALQLLPDLLSDGGRLLIISFHSLEDRIVKYAFREDDRLKIITKKPIIASPTEQQRNPRSRSAKLRVAERAF